MFVSINVRIDCADVECLLRANKLFTLDGERIKSFVYWLVVMLLESTSSDW